jgi:hypothetical protein
MDSREAMGELMQYCWVAATAVHKFNTGRISEDELGHLVQVPALRHLHPLLVPLVRVRPHYCRQRRALATCRWPAHPFGLSLSPSRCCMMREVEERLPSDPTHAHAPTDPPARSLFTRNPLGKLAPNATRLQIQIRLAQYMVEEAMQQLGAKVGPAAFVDLVDFPGSTVHMFAGGATADGAADRVLQTLQRALAKDAAGAMIRNLLEIISFDRVLAACLKSHLQHAPPALLPRTLNAVQLLAAAGGDLGRRFASEELGVVSTLIGLLETPPPIASAAAAVGENDGSVEKTATAGADAGEAVGATSADAAEAWAACRIEVQHRASAALINLALVVPELRDTLAMHPAVRATVAGFYEGCGDQAMTVGLVYVVSMLACLLACSHTNLRRSMDSQYSHVYSQHALQSMC